MPPLLAVGALGVWLKQHHLPTGLMLMGFPVLFGLLFTFPVRRTRFVFSRASRTLEIRKASLWSRRTRTIPLGQIIEAEVESRRRVGATHRTRVKLRDGRVIIEPKVHRPVLVVGPDEERVPLHIAYDYADDGPSRVAVETMNAWLRVADPRWGGRRNRRSRPIGWAAP
jgi:hypothetical protein